MARDGFRIFDSDTHVGPDMKVIERYLSSAERSKLDAFAEFRRVEKRTGQVTYIMGRRAFERRLGNPEPPATKEAKSLKPGWKGRDPEPDVDLDATARLRDMDLEGVDVNLTLPSSWWGTWMTAAQDIEGSMYRAYHDWMRDYCAATPGRLFGVILVSGRDIPAGLAEIERCARDSWPLALFCYAPTGMPLDHPDLDAYWAAAQDHNLAVVLHTFTSMPPYAPGSLDTWENHWIQSAAAHPWCGQRNMAALLGCGLLDRYPTLNLGVLEAGHGWLPFWTKRLDELAIRAADSVLMKQRPTDYVRSGRYFQSIEIAEGQAVTESVIQQVGDGVLMYASDYPHNESWFPKSVDTVMEWAMPEDTKRKLLWDNAVRFYSRFQSVAPPLAAQVAGA